MTRLERHPHRAQWTRAVVLGTALSLATGACAASRAQSGRTCDGGWSTPFPLETADRRPVYIEPGIILPQDDRILVIGAPTFFWMQPDSLLRAASTPEESARMTRAVVRGGALLDEQGPATPVPPLDDRFSETPRLLLAIRGQLLVAWVASDSPVVRGTSSFNRLEISTLRGAGWRDSQTLMHGQQLNIGQPPAARAPAADGDAVIAATFQDSTGRRARLAWKK